MRNRKPSAYNEAKVQEHLVELDWRPSPPPVNFTEARANARAKCIALNEQTKRKGTNHGAGQTAA